jgi:hypothetical protein
VKARRNPNGKSRTMRAVGSGKSAVDHYPSGPLLTFASHLGMPRLRMLEFRARWQNCF